MINFSKNMALLGSALMTLAIPRPWPYRSGDAGRTARLPEARHAARPADHSVKRAVCGVHVEPCRRAEVLRQSVEPRAASG